MEKAYTSRITKLDSDVTDKDWALEVLLPKNFANTIRSLKTLRTP